MPRVASIILLLALALTALTVAAQEQTNPAPQAAQPGAINPDFMGMVIRDPWYDFNTNPDFPGEPNKVLQETMGANLERIGVRWVRLDFHIQLPYSSSDDQVNAEIAKNDFFINEVAPRHGLKVLALLSFALVQDVDPRRLGDAGTTDARFGGGVNDYMRAWLNRALLISRRYRGNIAGYEVLNEENRLSQFAGKGPAGDGIDPKLTGRLLTKFYRFCKNINPITEHNGCGSDTKIILGGIQPRGTGTGAGPAPNYSDVTYLKAIYQDQTSFGDFKALYGFYPVDGIGYHPYPEEIRLSPSNIYVNRGIDRMRLAIDLFDPGKPFWLTEVGYNVGFDPDGPKNPLPAQTEAGQADFMRDVYTSMASRADVASVLWFKYEDFPPASGPSAQQWGVVRIPFISGNCPGGACYDPSGVPKVFRASYFTYANLSGKAVILGNPRYLPMIAK